MRYPRLVPSLVLVAAFALTALPAAAAGEEFVEFADGRFLQVQAHKIVNGRVQLTLESGATMLIPGEAVDRISKNDRTVYTTPAPETAKRTPQSRSTRKS